MSNPEKNDGPFSGDAEEQLRIENEILQLKLRAELGGEYVEIEQLEPEIENMFLANILEFENRYANAPIKTVYDILGSPEIKKATELSDGEIVQALHALEEIMKRKEIVVDYEVDYPARQKYEFLTEELFAREASMIVMPGMTTHFIYEEFHPNHEYYIRQRAQQFISDWFGRSFDEYSFELAPTITLPDDTIATREAFIQKIKLVFDSFKEFKNYHYSVEKISFDLNEEEVSVGFADGDVQYEGVLENDEIITISGSFTFRMQMDRGMWQITAFKWPYWG